MSATTECDVLAEIALSPDVGWYLTHEGMCPNCGLSRLFDRDFWTDGCFGLDNDNVCDTQYECPCCGYAAVACADVAALDGRFPGNRTPDLVDELYLKMAGIIQRLRFNTLFDDIGNDFLREGGDESTFDRNRQIYQERRLCFGHIREIGGFPRAEKVRRHKCNLRTGSAVVGEQA